MRGGGFPAGLALTVFVLAEVACFAVLATTLGGIAVAGVVLAEVVCVAVAVAILS